MLLIMTDDVGFGAPSTFGGVIPTPALDRDRQSGASLHAIPFHGALFADSCGVDHRTQSSLGRLRRGLGKSTGFPGYDSIIAKDSATLGTILKTTATHFVVRQGPQHANLSGQPGRTVRPMADRNGLRLFLRIRRRRHQPVAAEPVSATRLPSIRTWTSRDGTSQPAMADEAIDG